MFLHLKPIRRIIKRVMDSVYQRGACFIFIYNPDCICDLFPPGNLLLRDAAEQTNGSTNQVEKML